MAWRTPDKAPELAAPALARPPVANKPSILIFIGGGDSNNCCAKNFERSIFRAPDIVQLCADKFLCVKADRASDVAKPFNLKTVAIIVQDAEGNEVARFTQCTDGNKVLAAMKEALNDKARTTTGQYTKELEKAEKLLHDCSAVTGAALKARIVRALRTKFLGIDQSLADAAAPRLDEAKAKDGSGEVGTAWILFRGIRSDFQGVSASDTAASFMAEIEKDPENKPFVSQAALDSAKQLAHDGKRKEAQEALAAVARDFAGTAAASEATSFGQQVAQNDWKPDPSWKPAAPGVRNRAPAPAPAEPSMGGNDDK